LTVLRSIRHLGYGQVCKIHAKRSLHRQDGDRWRQEFLGRMLGSRSEVKKIVSAFEKHPDIGMVGPAGHWLAYSRYWGHPGSPARTQGLLEHLGISLSLHELCFFAGSMFWCRPAAMDPLLAHIQLEDFEEEEGQTDGTLAHALERVFAASCQAAGLRVTDTQTPAAVQEPIPEYHYPYALPSATLGGEPQGLPAAPDVKTRAYRKIKRVARGVRHRLG
jgi:lipopolysaccharide biosynthesis protein